ncbi:MAG: SPFH domain-containing protein [Proteobacteria bacterium]|nr:SPFH domain-containing protein [Pseudomonadota bacterium]MBU1742098.1 SPFH domain-containing protein [Pseudomonadota bacterium]
MTVIDRVKFDAASDEVFVWKYPSENLALGTVLVVNQSQEAVLVKGGRALDVFGPGSHTLSTGNVPLLRRLINLPFGGRTPFTAEVWFVRKTVKRDLKWGTRSPIPLLDPRFNFPISVQAYGRWGLSIADSRRFVTRIVGSLPSAGADKIHDYFIGEIVQRFSDQVSEFFLGEGRSIFQVNAFLDELSLATRQALDRQFGDFGLEVINFNIERISIPESEKAMIQEVMGRRMEIEELAGANVDRAYTTVRTFDTLEKSAENPGGGAGGGLSGGLGVGLGLGAGLPLGEKVGRAMDPGSGSPADGPDTDPAEKLRRLGAMLEEGLISQEEYDRVRKRILDEF